MRPFIEYWPLQATDKATLHKHKRFRMPSKADACV